MKIAYISQAYPPIVSGASFALQRLAEGMVQRGHQVMVLAPSDLKEPYSEQNKNMRIVRLKSNKKSNEVLSKVCPLFIQTYPYRTQSLQTRSHSQS